MMRRGLRIGAMVLIVLVGLVSLVIVYWLIPVWDDPTAEYRAADTTLGAVNEERRWREDESRYKQLTLQSQSGIRVPVTIRQPLSGAAKAPVMVLLGGQGTGRDACGLIPTEVALSCVSLSYPYEGKADLHGLSALWHIPAVQRAIVNTPPAVMLAINYIAQHDELNAGHIELVGVSLGAFLVSVPAAMDTRVRRLWLIHGAAQPAEVLAHQLRQDIGHPLLRGWAGEALSILIAGPYLKPERWVGRVSPRPVVLINGREDEALPPATIQHLHEAAREPREIIWTEGGHVLPGRRHIIKQLTNLVVQRIEGEELPPAPAN